MPATIPTGTPPATFVKPEVGTTPTTNTTAYKQQETFAQAQKLSAQLFTAKAVGLRQIFNLVWANQYGLSPALAIQAFGTSAVLAFTQFAAEVALLNAAAPAGWVYPDTKASIATTLAPPAGYVIANNTDGTITITEPT